MQKINPNLAAGIWVQDEKLTLNKSEISYLKHPYVIRTKLSDIKITSKDKSTVYSEDIDYKIIKGDMSYPYTPKINSLKLFGIKRIKGTKIPNGSKVLVSYDYVDQYRASTTRTDIHIPYCPLEPQANKLMGDFVSGVFRENPIKYAMLSHCLLEAEPPLSHLETDSRVIKSGKSPISLYVKDAVALHQKIKSINPEGKNIIWAGTLILQR